MKSEEMLKFGADEYDNELCDVSRSHYFEKSAGVVRSSRDLNIFLAHYKKYGPDKCYIYTGRGPSSVDMHLGHMVPFLVTVALQRALGVRVVVHLTDDEKFLFRAEHDLETYQDFAESNKRLIEKCGLDPKLTDIYIGSKDIARFYPTILKIQQRVNLNQVSAVFGFKGGDNIGKVAFPAYEMAPCDPRCLFSASDALNMRCLVVCAQDQDPFFRMVRDHSKALGFHKPSLLHLNYLPALDGSEKMSSTGATSAHRICLGDTPKQILKKTRRAFSGGQQTKEAQLELGADINVDIACIYMRFFMTDRVRYRELCYRYKSGLVMSGDVKNICAEMLRKMLEIFD